MADTNTIYYHYRLTIYYHYHLTIYYHEEVNDRQPDFYNDDQLYFTWQVICFGHHALLNNVVLDYVQDHCDPGEIDRVYRCLWNQFPQAYQKFQQTGQLWIWRRYWPNAPWAKWWLQELRAHRHASQDH